MNTFTIKKKSGTYSELLETYGLANTLHKIFDAIDNSDVNIVISDEGLCYVITTSIDISDKMLNDISYFHIFKYIKQNIDSNINGIFDFYDYPEQRIWKSEKRDSLKKVFNDFSLKDKKEERFIRISEIESFYEKQKPIDIEFDVYSQIASNNNNFSGFCKIYNNFFNNSDNFDSILKLILNNYSDKEQFILSELDLKVEKSVAAIQLYNPNQGKGLKSPKANSAIGANFSCNWISEAMKISGALSDMICQLVKVGSTTYDLKIFVPKYKQVNYGFKNKLIPNFKKYLKGNTPIKIDILNILLLTQKILENDEFAGRNKKVKDVVSGLYSVYQKNMGQNRAVMNIYFIQIPNFIEIGSKKENLDWIELLKEQRLIFSCMDEDKGAIQGLIKYRNFISASDIECFFDFSFWYAAYLSNCFSNRKFAKVFTIELLNKLYSCMDTQNLKLMEIIGNKGFQAVAKAIRKSTVSLQYTPKDARQYDIRYGVAPALQIKSRSSEDLAAFIGEFISTYNAETARYAEKNGKSLRANVREDELNDFYSLLDKYSSQLVGALLASYGFALPQNDHSNHIFEEEGSSTDTNEV
jgi:hypothetical protein